MAVGGWRVKKGEGLAAAGCVCYGCALLFYCKVVA